MHAITKNFYMYKCLCCVTNSFQLSLCSIFLMHRKWCTQSPLANYTRFAKLLLVLFIGLYIILRSEKSLNMYLKLSECRSVKQLRLHIAGDFSLELPVSENGIDLPDMMSSLTSSCTSVSAPFLFFPDVLHATMTLREILPLYTDMFCTSPGTSDK